MRTASEAVRKVKLVHIHLQMSAKSFASFAKNFANFAVKIISYPKNSETQSNKKKSLAPKVVTKTFRTAS